jgi:hypothetical protein
MAAIVSQYFSTRQELISRGIKHTPAQAWALACALLSR